MPRTAILLGPADHGRRMRLGDFDRAEGSAGRLYELSRGRIVVVDVPDARHFAQVEAIRDQPTAYKLANRGRVHGIAGGAECKLVIPNTESERHPDLALYKTPPPATANVWASWIPELVVEVVSAESAERDYAEKREDYLQASVKKYWIVDAERQEVLVLRRYRGRWAERTLRPQDTYATRLLPGFEFACATVFDAAFGD